jgi:hypothetical protein
MGLGSILGGAIGGKLFGSKSKGIKAVQSDPGQMAGQYLFGQDYQNTGGFAGTRFQQDIINAESKFGPQYTGLELENLNTQLYGLQAGRVNPEVAAAKDKINSLNSRLADSRQKARGKRNRRSHAAMVASLEQQLRDSWAAFRNIPKTIDTATPGLLEQQRKATIAAGETQRGEEELQRGADVGALQEYAPQVVEAYRSADPYSTGLAEQQTAMANDLYQRAQGLNPEQQRIADQQALGMSQRQGRINDQSSIAGQLLGRESYLSGLRSEAAGMGQQAFAQNRVMAGDVGSAILGRPTNSAGFGNQYVSQGIQGASSVGPSLFDANAGVNFGMQQQSNDMSRQGANAQAKATGKAAMMQAGTSVAIAAI